jgi:hypothetical protein
MNNNTQVIYIGYFPIDASNNNTPVITDLNLQAPKYPADNHPGNGQAR